MNVTIATSAMACSPAAGDDCPQLNPSGLIREPVMSIGMRARIARMWMPMRMRRKLHRNLMIDQRRLWRTESIVLVSVKIGQYISDM